MAAPMKKVVRLTLGRFPDLRHRFFANSGLTYARYSSFKSSVNDILMTVPDNTEKETLTQGWVKSIRQHKDLIFLHICDGTCLEPVQIVLDKNKTDNKEFTNGCCVSVKGRTVKSLGKHQNVEIIADTIDIIGSCDPVNFPFQQRKHHTSEYDRGFPHLRAKTKSHGSLLRVRNQVTMAIHKYFQDNDYCFIHTPILTTNDCEGAGEVFQIEPMRDKSSKSRHDNSEIDKQKEFFGSPTYLTVSGQLHLEVISGGFRKGYNFGPTFRAENSRGRHHLSEFYMVEAELSFLDNLDELMMVMEDLIKTITRAVLKLSKNDVDYFFNEISSKQHQDLIEKISTSNFERLTYTEAVKILKKNNDNFQFKIEWGDDLQKEHEKYLTRELNNNPVFVTDFPATLKPFYARINEDKETVAAVDLLVPEVGELIGGSVREERLNILEDKLKSLHLSEDYQWYLDLRRYGSSPHGGFGLGFERYLQFLLGISNIRDVIPFPRSPGNCRL